MLASSSRHCPAQARKGPLLLLLLLLLLLIQEMLMMSVAHRSLWGLRKMQLPSIAL
jgi:hypothetical protein